MAIYCNMDLRPIALRTDIRLDASKETLILSVTCTLRAVFNVQSMIIDQWLPISRLMEQ